MPHFVLELEVTHAQQPVFKMTLPVLATTDDYDQKRNFRRALDNCKDGYVFWSNSRKKPKGKLGGFSLVEEFLSHVEDLIEENVELPSGITYGRIIGKDLFYQVSVRGA